MASVKYLTGIKKIMDADIDLTADTIKVAMTTSSYTPNGDSDEFFDDISNEVSGTGYTAGGATLTSKATNIDTGNNRVEFDAADVTWSTATITDARYAIVYKSTGTDSTSALICAVDFGADKSSSAADFTITWDAEGIFHIG